MVTYEWDKKPKKHSNKEFKTKYKKINKLKKKIDKEQHRIYSSQQLFSFFKVIVLGTLFFGSVWWIYTLITAVLCGTELTFSLWWVFGFLAWFWLIRTSSNGSKRHLHE